MYYDSITQLLAAANKKVEKILITDVAPAAKQVLVDHINSDIYGAYSPKKYQRRQVLPVGRILVRPEGDNTIFISSLVPGNTVNPTGSWTSHGVGSFLKMLEVGNMGWWKEGFPRPAVTNAQNEITSNNKVVAAIRRGIAREFG